MEIIPKDLILEYNEDTLQAVRETFGLEKPGDMKNAVDILDEWVKRQNHFTKKDFDRRYLENIIITSKGSLEKAKTRLDRACTFKTCNPHLFNVYYTNHLFDEDLKELRHGVLPKLTKNHERVYVMRNKGQKFEPSFLSSSYHCFAVLAEYIRLYDYAITHSVVIDYQDVNLPELIKVFGLSELRDTAAMLLDCYGFRMKALYIISSSKLIDTIVFLFKQVLSAKLGQRIYVVKSREELKNYIEAEILPEEYGGNERSLEKIHDEWIQVFASEKYVDYIKEMYSARTNESLRQKHIFNEQYMGMPGSFRKLNVD